MKRIFVKYKNMNKAVKASLWFAICNIFQKGISLLATPIFTRLLTPEQYGDYTLYQSWYQVISIIATLNLFYGVFNNGMTKYDDDRLRFVSSMQGLCTTLTIGLFLIYLIGIHFWNALLGMPTIYMLAMFIELLFVPAFNFWSAEQRYDYRYRWLVIITIIISLGSPLLGVITVISSEYKAEARVLSFVFVQVCIGLIFYIYNMYRGKCFFNKNYWIFALKFNIALIPHYLSAVVLGHADRIMISNMVGKGEAAIYGVAYSIAMMMNIITTAINNSYTPFMYKELKNKSYIKIKKTSVLLVFFVAICCMISMTLAPEIVKIFAPSEYYDAIWIIPPVACSVFFNFLYPLFSNVEFYYEKPQYIMLASMVGAVLNIILNAIFIPIWGYYAAGYTTLICYIIYVVVHYLLASMIIKKQGIKEVLFYKKGIFLISVIILGVMVLSLFLYQCFILRYIIFVLEMVIALLFIKKYFSIYKSENENVRGTINEQVRK